MSILASPGAGASARPVREKQLSGDMTVAVITPDSTADNDHQSPCWGSSAQLKKSPSSNQYSTQTRPAITELAANCTHTGHHSTNTSLCGGVQSVQGPTSNWTVRERTDLSCPPTPSKPFTLTYHLRVRLAFHSAVPMTLVHLALNLCSKRRKEARRASSANLLCLGMWHSAVAGLSSTALAWPAWAWALPQHHKRRGGSCILDSSLMQKADGHFQSCQCSRPSQSQELRAQSSTADEQVLRTRPRPPVCRAL